MLFLTLGHIWERDLPVLTQFMFSVSGAGPGLGSTCARAVCGLCSGPGVHIPPQRALLSSCLEGKEDLTLNL